MLVTLVTVWLIELPVAWLLAGTSVGVVAIGWAAVAAMGGRLLFYIPYFFHGRWLRIKVI
jgi:Na+-driven multidrug efflux pump